MDRWASVFLQKQAPIRPILHTSNRIPSIQSQSYLRSDPTLPAPTKTGPGTELVRPPRPPSSSSISIPIPISTAPGHPSTANTVKRQDAGARGTEGKGKGKGKGIGIGKGSMNLRREENDNSQSKSVTGITKSLANRDFVHPNPNPNPNPNVPVYPRANYKATTKETAVAYPPSSGLSSYFDTVMGGQSRVVSIGTKQMRASILTTTANKNGASTKTNEKESGQSVYVGRKTLEDRENTKTEEYKGYTETQQIHSFYGAKCERTTSHILFFIHV
jgi:hypothetical protein